jgi:3-oxoadipate enol-lactonase
METAIQEYDLTINLNGFKISYDDVGEGRIPILFLHGFPFNKTIWQEQIDNLKSSYRVIACDLRGFGKSVDEESNLSINLFVKDLIQFMDKLELEKVILCGLSMGGYIALNAIKQYPNRFEALILCDTQSIADSDEVKAKRYDAIAEIQENGTTNFNESFLKNVFHKDSLTNKPELVDDLRTVVYSNSQNIMVQGLRAIAERKDTSLILDEINVPTLIICGRQDIVTPLDESKYINKFIKGSVLHVINYAGHVSNLEEPMKFNKLIRNFLNDFCETASRRFYLYYAS